MLGTVVKPISGVVDLVSKTTEGVESAVDGGICKANNRQMRLGRPFYQTAGIFRSYNEIHATLYFELRDTHNAKNACFASATDIFYGAFKLGNVLDMTKVDSPMIMLTENNLVRFKFENNKLQLDWVIKTEDMERPKTGCPNPSREGSSVFLRIRGKVDEPIVLLFANERVAEIVTELFADMFYTKKSA